MLGEMVRMKAEAVIRLGQLHAGRELLAERHTAVVHVVEHAELHVCCPPVEAAPASMKMTKVVAQCAASFLAV
jgi:hypothetical protein